MGIIIKLVGEDFFYFQILGGGEEQDPIDTSRTQVRGLICVSTILEFMPVSLVNKAYNYIVYHGCYGMI